MTTCKLVRGAMAYPRARGKSSATSLRESILFVRSGHVLEGRAFASVSWSVQQIQPQELVPACIRSEKIFRHGVVFGRGSAVQIDMTARQAGTRQRAMIDVNVRRKPSPRHMRGQRASIGASPKKIGRAHV